MGLRDARMWILATALVPLCGACGGGSGAAENGAARAEGPERDSVAVSAYRSPEGFPLPFSTTVLAGFRPAAEPDGPGAAVRFAWTPAGERSDSAFVYVRVMRDGTSAAAAREIVRAAAERTRIPGDRSELAPRAVHPWAVVEYPIASVGTFGERVQGWVALGRRDARWFYVIVQSPVEAWPRFAPGAELILDRWRWTGADGGPADSGLGEG